MVSPQMLPVQPFRQCVELANCCSTTPLRISPFEARDPPPGMQDLATGTNGDLSQPYHFISYHDVAFTPGKPYIDLLGFE